MTLLGNFFLTKEDERVCAANASLNCPLVRKQHGGSGTYGFSKGKGVRVLES